MSVQLTQPETLTKETIELNKQTSGLTGKQISETSSVSEARTAISAGRKNLLFNGNFDIWQRGTSFSNAGFSADRLFIVAPIVPTTKESDPVEQNVIAITPPNTSCAYLSVPINDISITKQQYTLSVRFKSTASLYPNIGYRDGVGAGTRVGISSLSHTATNSPNDEYNTVSWTFTIDIDPLGSTNVLEIILITDTIGDVVRISQVQLEEGSTATEFEQRPIGEELDLCQRYYQKSYDLDIAPGTVNSNGQIRERATRNSATSTGGRMYQTRMRVNPTVVIYSPITGAAGMIDNGGDKAAIAAPSVSGEARLGYVSITAGITASETRYHFTADAEL